MKKLVSHESVVCVALPGTEGFLFPGAYPLPKTDNRKTTKMEPGFMRLRDSRVHTPPPATTGKQQQAQRLIEANEKNMMNEIKMNTALSLQEIITSAPPRKLYNASS